MASLNAYTFFASLRQETPECYAITVKLKLCDKKKTATTEHHVFDNNHYLIHMSEPANGKLKSYQKTFS